MHYSYTYHGVPPEQAPCDGGQAMLGYMPYDASRDFVQDYGVDFFMATVQNVYTPSFQPFRNNYSMHEESMDAHITFTPELQFDSTRASNFNSDALTDSERHDFPQEAHASPPSSKPLPGSAYTPASYSQATVGCAQGYPAPPTPSTLLGNARCQWTNPLGPADQPPGYMGTTDFSSGVQANVGYKPLEPSQSAPGLAYTDNSTLSDLLQIPQMPYSLGSACDAEESLPAAVPMYIPAQLALDTKLPRGLAERCGWLETAWSDPNGKRKNLKWTVRFKFQGYDDNAKPQQFNAWSAGQKLPVYAEWAKGEKLRFWPWPRRQPLSKLELAWRVAEELKAYMQALEHDKNPLMWGGRELCFEHIVIAEIHRCSKGSVQPTLAIHPYFARLYQDG